MMLVTAVSSACRQSGGTLASAGARPTLRVGVGGASTSGNESFRTVAQLQMVEDLALNTTSGKLRKTNDTDRTDSPSKLG